ncbi:MAG: YbhB/YbcL family Raf kinase inhibitor-like protein [Stenotrophobium sp.]
MKLSSRTFNDGGLIPGRCAFCVKAPNGHVTLSLNLNPELNWSHAPVDTRSFVITCIDTDAPTRPDDVNQDGREVPAGLPRSEFVHWLMVDVPAGITQIAEGACSEGVTAKGKGKPAGPAGSRQSVNDYTGWFAGDGGMAGNYLGYDGPCPPWNDALVHHYNFTVYATGLEKCPVVENFTLKDLRTALNGQVLSSASIIGRYSLNPRFRLV